VSGSGAVSGLNRGKPGSRPKGQKSSSPGQIMLKVKVNFKLGRRLVHALSTTMASYKVLCNWAIARRRGNSVSAAPATATQVVTHEPIIQFFALGAPIMVKFDNVEPSGPINPSPES